MSTAATTRNHAKLVSDTIAATRGESAARAAAKVFYAALAELPADQLTVAVENISKTVGTVDGILTSDELARRDEIAAMPDTEFARSNGRTNALKQAVNPLYTLAAGLNRALDRADNRAVKATVTNKGGQTPSIAIKANKTPKRPEMLTLSASVAAEKIAASDVFAAMAPDALVELARQTNAALKNIDADTAE